MVGVTTGDVLNPEAWQSEQLLAAVVVMVLAYKLLQTMIKATNRARASARKGRREEVQHLRKENRRLRKRIAEYHEDYERIVEALPKHDGAS